MTVLTAVVALDTGPAFVALAGLVADLIVVDKD